MARATPVEGEGKRLPLNVRTTHSLRSRLDAAAVASGRSLAQEVENRLERSFDLAPLVAGMTDHDATRQFFGTMARVLGALRRRALEKDWSEVDAREAMRTAVENIAATFFWTGGGLPDAPDERGAHGQPRKPPSPAQVGYTAANDRMIYDALWDECPLSADLEDERIMDRWTGDGTARSEVTSAPLSNKPASRPLADIAADMKPSKKRSPK